MEKLIEKYKGLRTTKGYKFICLVVLPLIILGLSLFNVNKGIDITDTGYNFSNFKYFANVDPMWKFSVFLSNGLGFVLTRLPGGATLLGINIYTHICKGLVLVAAYYFFTFVVKLPGEWAFLAEVVAWGYSWAPTAAIYQYLSYAMLFAGCALVYLGITKGQRKWYIIAGLVIGASVFVRLPNLASVLLIFAVWYAGIISHRKFAEVMKDTGCCVLGFVISVGVIFTVLGLCYGFGTYIDGIKDLFNMTGDASAYSGSGQVSQLIEAIKNSWPYLELTFLTAMAGLLVSLVLTTDNLAWLRYVLSVPIALLLLYLLKSKGYFDFRYTVYSSIYMFGVLVTEMAFIASFVAIFLNRHSFELRVLALITLVNIVVTPLGSNNVLYTNMNNMLFALPVLVMILLDCKATTKYLNSVRFLLGIVLCAALFQGVMFGTHFVFRDGQDAPMDTEVRYNDVLKGMKTTKENAERLEAVTLLFNDKALRDNKVITYGDVCALAYYMDAEPALITTWPTLQSFTVEKFDSEMKRVRNEIDNEGAKKPVVILAHDILAENLQKQEILNTFLQDYLYEMAYTNDSFCVLVAQ